MRKFEIPNFYKSPIISKIKSYRREKDKLKKDFTPTVLDFNSVEIIVPRHFGFCYGVENAIEIVYKTIRGHPDNNIYLLSEMIHNPLVNKDLISSGVQFLQDTQGQQLIPWDKLRSDDIVLIPAFGTTVEIEDILKNIGVEIKAFNTTCPFVEKVWNRSASLGKDGYTVIVHGKANHEETRATFSHSAVSAPVIIVENIEEARVLGKFIRDEISADQIQDMFSKRVSPNFDLTKDLRHIGVVNQTTMLATDTMEISSYLKDVIHDMKGKGFDLDFADTRDTLCYATLDNQRAVAAMLEGDADYTLVIGGYNSSNTSHLVELCERKNATFFINSEKNIKEKYIEHYSLEKKILENSPIPKKATKMRIMITSGASCPDSVVDRVIQNIVSKYPNSLTSDEVLKKVILN